MKTPMRFRGALAGFAALMIATMLTACGGGGGRDPILGTGGNPVAVPTVTAVTPLAGATGVTIGAPITATFSTAMAPGSLNISTFLLSCPAATAIAGTVTYDAALRRATFTPTTVLPLNTACTATITTGATDSSGVPLAANFTWTFTTIAVPDTTRPRVLSTVPVTTIPGPTPGIATNTAITATFTEDMAPATINATSFTLTCPAPCVSPAGTVSYSAGTRTAIFMPAAMLNAGTTYTATITSAATDLSGNALAGNQGPLPGPSNYVWTFTTAGPTAPANISVSSSNPTANATGVCPSASVNVTFSVPSGTRIDPATVNATNFTVTGPAPGSTPVTATSITLDPATGLIATFTPAAPFVSGTTYTATIRGGATGVRDLAMPPNVLANNFTFNFTAGPATGACTVVVAPPPVTLGTASSFGMLGGTAGMTNQGIFTVINGNIGTTATATSAVTGFRDSNGDFYTVTTLNNGAVNGRILTCTVSTTGPTSAAVNPANCTAATQARNDAFAAYNTLAGLPGGSDPGAGNLANLVLGPGTYTASGGSFRIQGGNLTLDAQGNANAVFVFQMATSLTVGGPGAAAPQSVILVNGAQASNVFWQVGSAATINAGGGGTMVGTILAQAGVAFSTAGNVTVVTLNGRAASLNASVTVVNTVINVP